jgi:hypothetical protein
MSLARDATSSGDPVLAENYLQHAEHYNRIIMAVRDQQISQGGGELNGGIPRQRPFNDIEGDDYGDDEGDDDMQPMHHQQPQPQMRHNDQPRMEGQRFDGGQRHFRDRNGHHRGNRNNHDRGDRHDRGERHDRGGEPGGQPQQRARSVEPSEGMGQQQPTPEAQPPQRRERFSQQPHEQPEFLRRPVRRPRRESNGGAAPEANGAAAADESDRD